MASFDGVHALVEERASACVPVICARKGTAHLLAKGSPAHPMAKGTAPPGSAAAKDGSGAATLADVTHVITHRPEMLKSTKVVWDAVTIARADAGKPNPIAVAAEWVGESVLAGRLLPEERYPVVIPAERKALGRGWVPKSAPASAPNVAPNSALNLAPNSAPSLAPDSAPASASNAVLNSAPNTAPNSAPNSAPPSLLDLMFFEPSSQWVGSTGAGSQGAGSQALMTPPPSKRARSRSPPPRESPMGTSALRSQANGAVAEPALGPPDGGLADAALSPAGQVAGCVDHRVGEASPSCAHSPSSPLSGTARLGSTNGRGDGNLPVEQGSTPRGNASTKGRRASPSGALFLESTSSRGDDGGGGGGDDCGADGGSLNDHLIGPLKEMRMYYDTALKKRCAGNQFKQLVYGRAIDALKRLRHRVDRIEDLPPGTQFIGESIRKHIEEILATGTFPQLEGARNSEEAKIIKRFMDVPWFGPSKAEELYNKGCRTLEDVARDPSLNSIQRICLEHAEDLMTPIPRYEVTEIAKWVSEAADKVAPKEGLRVICGGSYRRGEPQCNDIDFVITHEDGVSHRGLCNRLVGQLEVEGLVTHRLGSGSHYWKGPKTKWELEDPTQTFMGICRLPENHAWATLSEHGVSPPEHYRYRRIDIKVYPRAAFAFASIYFTGGLLFNRSLRGHARTGMHPPHKLTDRGLFPVMKLGATHADDLVSAQSVPCAEEEDVLRVMGVRYKLPEQRKTVLMKEDFLTPPNS
eukprot:jgi/Mesvir1/20467/Mv12357-RA.3